MNCLVIALMLAAAQTTPSVQRKAPADATHTGQAIQHEVSKQADAQLLPTTQPLTIQTKRDWADWAYWGFNGFLALSSILQIMLLRATWKAIDRQARLMEFAQQQWVELGNWGAKEDVDERSQNQRSLDCHFDVVNNTALPITLLKVRTRVLRLSRHEEHRRISRPEKGYEVTENLSLLPKGKDEAYRYPCMIPVVLEREEIPVYLKSNLFICFLVQVTFVGAEGRERTQDFKQLVTLGPDKISLWEPGGALPDEHEHNEEWGGDPRHGTA